MSSRKLASGSWLLVMVLTLFFGCTSTPSAEDDVVATKVNLITANDCQAAAVNGKVGICHATGSSTNPYTHIKVSVSGCANGHAKHEGDFISDDTSCRRCAQITCVAIDQCHVPGVCDPTTGLCSTPPASDGTTCNDGNSCTQTDTCVYGTCTGASPVTCTALDQCHDAGACDPSTGACSNPDKLDGTACNDGNACTQTDVCQAGECTGTNLVVCVASDQCHAPGACNTTNGTCSNPPVANGAACNDGNACTQTDACQAGTCAGTNPVICMASDQCHAPGICNTTNGTCSNPPVANGTACNDGNACTQTDSCQAGECTGNNPVVCEAIDQCHLAGICDPTSGTCSNPQNLSNPPKVVATIQVGGHPGVIALNSTTKRLYVGRDPANSVAVVDMISNTMVATIPTAGYQNLGIATNPITGRVYINQSFANRVLIVDSLTNARIGDIPVPSSDTIYGIAVNPDTNRVYVVRNTPGGIIVMDGATNTCIAIIDLDSTLPSISSAGIAFDSTVNRIYIVDRPRDRMVIVDGNTNQIIGSIAVGPYAFGVAVNPTTRRVYVANMGSDTVSVIDTDSNALVDTISVGHGPAGVAVNLRVNRIYVSNYAGGSDGNSVSVIDGDTNALVATVPVGQSPMGVSIDPTTDLIYVANNTDGTISVISDCSCTPKTCADLGAECDSVPDGCGGTLGCGSCTAP
jgi:YVTN family beta-propeller protein